MCNKRSSTSFFTKKDLKEFHLDDWKFKVDSCMKNIIWFLNNHGCKTLGCCCGHGKYPMTIIYESPSEKRWELFTGVEIPRKKRFYLTDKEGYYYIPEITTPKTSTGKSGAKK